MVKRGKHAKRSFGSRKLPVLLILLAVGTVAIGGTAYAAMRYDRSTATTILPGVTISGIDVSGLTRSQALRTVKRATTTELERELVVTAGDDEWELSASELGVHADVSEAVGRAMAADDSLSFFSRVYHRVTDRPVDESFKVPRSSNKGAIEGFVDQVTEAVTVLPTDASITGAGGELEFQKGSMGQTLNTDRATASLRAALRGDRTKAELPLSRVKPEVTPKDLGLTIVVNRSNNTLSLYRGFDVWKTWGVATAAPDYETPPGDWTVINKRVNPTWVNPAPDTWGAGSPLEIPPGPDNPLGTRALDLDAPGIRIHGTYASDSIGTYASHGCIRMHIADSEELFDLVPVGTKVVIL